MGVTCISDAIQTKEKIKAMQKVLAASSEMPKDHKIWYTGSNVTKTMFNCSYIYFNLWSKNANLKCFYSLLKIKHMECLNSCILIYLPCTLATYSLRYLVFCFLHHIWFAQNLFIQFYLSWTSSQHFLWAITMNCCPYLLNSWQWQVSYSLLR